MMVPLLSILIFLPLLSAALILLLPKHWRNSYKYIALITTILQLILSAGMYQLFHVKGAGISVERLYQFQEKLPWIRLDLGALGPLEIQYFVGLDGISMPLVLLSSFILMLATAASWKVQTKIKGYFALILLLNTSIIGLFASLDLFLFYVFYELMLLPLYFLIGIWGGPRREYAAIKFFLYTLFGSVLMLLVIVGLYFSSQLEGNGAHTFNIIALMHPENYHTEGLLSLAAQQLWWGIPVRVWAFALLFFAFAIKIPIVPLHTWLPDAHVEAPTPISMILAGILLKVGAYGIIRLCFGLFPEVTLSASWWMGLIGVISILYGAFNALQQHDLKKMVAYASVSHMGFVLLGMASLTPEGIAGSMMQLLSHGVLSAGLFYLVGVLYDQTGDRNITHYKGLVGIMPQFTAWIGLSFFASLGVPGFSAFIGEAFVIIGAFSSGLPTWMAILGAFGIFLGATYFLWTLQRMFFGKLHLHGGEDWKLKLRDMRWPQTLMMILLLGASLGLGLIPSFAFDKMNASVLALVDWVQQSTLTK
jgi:NADH-quinone oxidoreductase subunit M